MKKHKKAMSEATMLTIQYQKMSVRRTHMSTSHPTIPDRWNIMNGACKFVSAMDARTWQVIEATKRGMAGVDRKGLVSASVYLIWTEPNSKVNRKTYKPVPFSIACVDQKDENTGRRRLRRRRRRRGVTQEVEWGIYISITTTTGCVSQTHSHACKFA